MRELTVPLGARGYPVRIGSGLLARPEQWRPWLRGAQALIVTDSNVAPHYLDTLRAGLEGFALETVILPPGEQEKNLARYGALMSSLAAFGAQRDVTIIALGGGVVGDLAGFAAATWMRGVAWLQMPTTLLAMVDAAVGGKTAVNLPQGKNLAGAFHQPVAVIADTDTLATLPEREFRAGFAEVIKYGAIRDGAFLAWLAARAQDLLARDADVLGEAIARSCRHKADIVARDEHESGERALLNFGHTFAHAIETVSGYGEFLHGEAVAVGMTLAARLSARLGLASDEDADRLLALLRTFGLPTVLPAGLEPSVLLAAMRLDKKSLSGRMRLVLWRGAGKAEVVAGIAERAVIDILRGN